MGYLVGLGKGKGTGDVARDAAGRRGHRPPGGSARPGKATYGGTGRRGPASSDEPGTGRPAREAPTGRSAAAENVAALRAGVEERLAPALAEAGFDLEDLSLSRAGSRSVLRVAVDREGGIDLDAVAEASRLISDLLDRVGDEAGLTGTYVLEVTSPGVGRPLTQPRHWRRARGRLVEARRADGTVVVGRVLGADDEGVDLAVVAGPVRRGRPARTRMERLRFAEVTRATVQVEFGHADIPDDASAGGAVASGGGRPRDDADPDVDDELGDDDLDAALDGFDDDDDDVVEDDSLDEDDWFDEDDSLDEDDGDDDGGWDESLERLGGNAPGAGGSAADGAPGDGRRMPEGRSLSRAARPPGDLGRARQDRAGGGREDGGRGPGEETDR